MNAAPILYLEDDENDAFLLRRAFQQADISNSLVIITDGSEALEYLAATGRYEDRGENEAPGLVLLDLNMPGKAGFEVLQWMRADPCCRTVPAIVLTSSNEDGDIARAYAEHANGFLVMRDFWLVHNRAPTLLPRRDLTPVSG
jgi:two-component system, response regulator